MDSSGSCIQPVWQPFFSPRGRVCASSIILGSAAQVVGESGISMVRQTANKQMICLDVTDLKRQNMRVQNMMVFQANQ